LVKKKSTIVVSLMMKIDFESKLIRKYFKAEKTLVNMKRKIYCIERQEGKKGLRIELNK
jgi:hypothetical protein